MNSKNDELILIEILLYGNKFYKLNAYTPNYDFVLSTDCFWGSFRWDWINWILIKYFVSGICPC